ncbi:calcium-binding protein [Kluyvera sichuanensis]
MSDLISSIHNAKDVKYYGESYGRDVTGAVVDLVQSIAEIIGKSKLPSQFVSVVSGKVGGVASVSILFDKYRKGEDTLSDWLGASSDIALLVSGYTGNPVIAGLATVLGVASFLTSDVGVGMGRALLGAVQKYGLCDPEGNSWLIPPNSFPNLLAPDMATPEKTTSPIILDLDGDGIETRGLQDGIFFDHDGNQFAENTGWVGADDGLLVLDRNNNGEIDTGQELFGSNTRLNDGSLAKNGYAALQELDSNQDGIINQDDEAWQQLQVWQDRNGNASVDEGELLSLEDAGIAAINTGYKNSNLVDQQGNAHKQTGTVIMQDGTINQSADVWFAANMGNTRYISDVDIPRNIRQLPYIRGFGNMADLHVAMSENAELRALIERFIADPLGPDVDSLLQDIIFTWAGVNDIASDSRGDYIDARYLAVLEVATGDNYQNIKNGTVDPLRNAGALLNKEYAKFADYIQASLLAQTVYREDLSHIGLQINSESNGFTLNFEAFEVHLNTLMKTDIGRYLSVSHVFYDQLTYMPAFADERERLGIAGDKIFSGGDGDDVLRDNYLSGNRTNDYFWGAAGNDTLDGGYGSDTYLFNAGDGQDTIVESYSSSSDSDTLRFGAAIQADSAIIQRSGNDLLIGFSGSDDRVTIKSYFSSSRFRVEHITFADGTDWQPEDILNHLEDGIQLPLAAPAEAPVSIQQMRELMATFSGGDEGSEDSVGDATPVLSTSRTTVRSLMCA